MHTAAFTHKKFYAQKLLHTEAFTAQQTETFTQSCFYPEQLLHTHARLHTEVFKHQSFCTRKRLWRTEPFR